MPDPSEARTPPDASDGDRTVIDWSPSGVVATTWVAMSILSGLLGLFLFGLVYAVAGSATPEAGVEFNAPVVAALAVVVLVLHQLIHAAVVRAFGGSPRFDVDVVQWILPVLYVRLQGQRFGRRQYVTYRLAPLSLLSISGMAGMLVDHRAASLIIPLALNAGMAMRDVWMAWVVWRQPDGTVVEEREDGFRLRVPGTYEIPVDGRWD